MPIEDPTAPHALELADPTAQAPSRSAVVTARTMEMLEEVSERLDRGLAELRIEDPGGAKLPSDAWLDSAKWLVNQVHKFEMIKVRRIALALDAKPEGGDGTPEDDFRVLLSIIQDLGSEQLALVKAAVLERERIVERGEIVPLPAKLRSRRKR